MRQMGHLPVSYFPQSPHVNYFQQLLTLNFAAPTTSNAGQNRFFEDFGVWKDAPILTGSTKYEPLPDVKNIMITGGAGFM
jgi:hypothetical protein